MNKITSLTLLAFLLASCASMTMQPVDLAVDAQPKVKFTQWDVPHTNLTMLLPDGWVNEYHQGTISIATNSKNFFYSPYEEFNGVLINMFVSDGPRAVGPSFDVMKLAADYIADQPQVIQAPTLVEADERQIVTTLHLLKDTKGTLITYLTGYIIEDQQLTVYMAATPNETESVYLPILKEMLYSTYIKSPQ